VISVSYDVPVPPRRGKEPKYPFRAMQPGGSFSIPIEGSARRTLNRLNSAAQNWRRRHQPTAKFRLQIEGQEVRIWLISL
jgi:hypothetical protein